MRTGRERIGAIALSGRRVVLLLGLLLLGGCWACSSAVSSKADSNRRLHDIGGFTLWSCDRPFPVAYVRVDDAMSPVDRRALEAHELSHAAFMRSFGSCAAYKRWRRASAENRITLESVAYCAQARSLIADGVPPAIALVSVARAMAGPLYGFRLSVPDAARRIKAVCS